MIGGCTVADDVRWAGAFGIDADFVAKTHCSVAFVSTEDMKVQSLQPFRGESVDSLDAFVSELIANPVWVALRGAFQESKDNTWLCCNIKLLS